MTRPLRAMYAWWDLYDTALVRPIISTDIGYDDLDRDLRYIVICLLSDTGTWYRI